MPELSDSSRRSDRREIVAFLGALCLFLSAVEYLIPKPVPFFRLGLANLPLLIGLTFLTPADLFLVLFLKVLGQGLINGTLTSYVFFFSLAGSTSSVLVMAVVYRLGGRHVSLMGVSLSGALMSSIVQVALSVAVIFGDTARLIAPLFLGLGTVTGLLIGVFAGKFVQSSRWFAAIKKRYLDSGGME